MLKLFQFFLLPLYLIGFLSGFILRPFCNGYFDGFFLFEISQHKKLLKNSEKA